jgi:RNA polymerase-binding transcription factor DksA
MATLSTYWSPSDLQTFRQALIDQHRVLSEQWHAAKRVSGPALRLCTANAAGSKAHTAAGHGGQLDARDAHIARMAGQLVAFERALKRLYRGVFGLCVDCHEDIIASQLRAQPATAYCPSCHRAHEARAAAMEADSALPIDAAP